MATVRIPTPLRSFTGGTDEVEVEATDLRAALHELGQQHAELLPKLLDDAGELRTFVNVFVGAQDQRTLQGLATKVQPGDVISILPAVAGGV